MDKEFAHHVRNLLARCRGPLDLLALELKDQPKNAELVASAIRAFEELKHLLEKHIPPGFRGSATRKNVTEKGGKAPRSQSA